MKISLPRWLAAVVPRSPAGLPRVLVVAAVPIAAGVVVAGVWVTGGLLTDDEVLARRLVGAWFVAAGVVAVVAALRWRQLLVPVLGTWFLTTAVVGGWLLLTSGIDRVVDEQVVVAADPLPTPAVESEASPEVTTPPPGPVAAAAGSFTDGAHPTSGTATLIDKPDGSRALTLTDFVTSPGPDLRLLLVPDRTGAGVENSVDLGALKGNKGNQEYAVPAGSPEGAVVIWCRAFTVAFGTASLAEA